MQPNDREPEPPGGELIVGAVLTLACLLGCPAMHWRRGIGPRLFSPLVKLGGYTAWVVLYAAGGGGVPAVGQSFLAATGLMLLAQPACFRRLAEHGHAQHTRSIGTAVPEYLLRCGEPLGKLLELVMWVAAAAAFAALGTPGAAACCLAGGASAYLLYLVVARKDATIAADIADAVAEAEYRSASFPDRR